MVLYQCGGNSWPSFKLPKEVVSESGWFHHNTCSKDSSGVRCWQWSGVKFWECYYCCKSRHVILPKFQKEKAKFVCTEKNTTHVLMSSKPHCWGCGYPHRAAIPKGLVPVGNYITFMCSPKIWSSVRTMLCYSFHVFQTASKPNQNIPTSLLHHIPGVSILTRSS